MAKSKSQRMKEYRARKKEQLGEKWLKRERSRVKAYYVPTEQLDDNHKQIRRDKNKKHARTFYEKRRKQNKDKRGGDDDDDDEHLNVTERGKEQEPCTSREDENGVSSTSALLTIKMPFNKTSEKKGKIKRASRALKRSYDRIETLEDKNEELSRKLKSAQRRIQRYESMKKKPKEPLTPKSKADDILKKAGLKPKEVPSIRKQLIYNECLNDEIKDTMTKNAKKMPFDIQKIVSGKIVKRYRMKSYLQQKAKINRRKQCTDKVFKIRKKQILREKAEKIKCEVQEFLCRDDNSRVLPGKADAVKVGQIKKQKRVLNDYLHNLHLKFRSESQYAVSLATFCRLRPKENSLVNFTSRSVCLCSKHQNFGFKLKCLKNMNVSNCTSPDSFVEMYKHTPQHLEALLEKVQDKKVKFQQWKRVKLQNGKERMRIIDIEVSRDDFINAMKKEFGDFVGHVDRVTKQYKSAKMMKENLPKNHVIIQMDFSENYNCQTMEEIQSAYWNASMVTLHPTIIYYKENSDNLCHKSFVFVSEVLHHNAAMVSVIVEKIVNTAKHYVPDLEYIHFWTDSPSSQYRNKSIFYLLNRFESIYGCKASWHYFESGHGKSACDGVGGTTKRNADMAIKQNKAVIQDANDFYAWAISSQSEIEYHLITPEEYEISQMTTEKRKQEIKPLKGTMLLHAITHDEGGIMLVRSTTCVCENCFDAAGFKSDSSCKWDKVSLKCTQSKPTDSSHETSQCATPTSDKPDENNSDVDVNVNDFVVALYDDIRYIGKVLKVDNDDETVFISFMVKSGKVLKRFRWPVDKEEVWIEKGDLLRRIEPPVANTKTGRIFSVTDDVIEFLEDN